MGLITDDDDNLSLGRILACGIVLLGIGSGLFLGCGSITNSWKYSEGDRVGMVNKVSKKGAIWKTNEGQMALEGIVSGGGSTGANVWDFSIDNYLPDDKQDELIKQLNTAMNAEQKVKIHYTEMFCTFPWRSGSNVLIQSVKPIQPAYPSNSSNTSQEGETYRKAVGSLEINLDGRDYQLKHDKSGKLKVTEMKEGK